MESQPIIYGLEYQARSLCSQQNTEEIRFVIATQSLKQNNQIHIVEVNEESSKLNSISVFSNTLGEAWKINSSPHDNKILACVFSNHNRKGNEPLMQTAILRLPETETEDKSKEFLEFADIEILNNKPHSGQEIKTTEFHPSNANLLASVIDGKVLIFNRAESSTKIIAEVTGKNSQKFSGGKWSNHHQGNNFIAHYENGIRSYDLRDLNHLSWSIEDAHSQTVRDIDCNPNKQTHIASVGDDCCLKIWDSRSLKECLFQRKDHQHWIWSVKYNTFHDQLILTSSSDGKVLLTCAGSCSSEAPQVDLTASPGKTSVTSSNEEYEGKSSKDFIADGLLQSFDQHEDSVYYCSWSAADPWYFASLSFDGRLVISKVPKQYKYRILL